MNINSYNNYNAPNFQARFFHSDALKRIADYAVETKQFDKLNQARKNITSLYFNTRLLVNIGKTPDNKPSLQISRFVKRSDVAMPNNSNDYKLVKQVTFAGKTGQNPLNFALKTLIRMGNNIPNNKIFQRAIVKK